jgi:hypothetical protein
MRPQHKYFTIGWRSASLLVGLAAILVLTGMAAAWQLILATKIEQPRKGAAVSIVSQLNFRYDSNFLWSILTMTSGLEAITGIRIDEADREKSIAKVGDWLGATVSSDHGRLIVTGWEQGRELRVMFEPPSAAYVVHKRFVVATAGNGSVLQYWSLYTDFEPEADQKASKEHQQIAASADAFRTLVESRAKPQQRPGH